MDIPISDLNTPQRLAHRPVRLLLEWRAWGYWLICLAILITSALFSGYRMAEPAWDGGPLSFVQSEYPQNARNYLRYGYLETGFAPVMNIGMPDPPRPWIFRFSHGPVTALLISVAYQIFGVSDFSARLVPVIFAIGTVTLTFLLALHLSRSRWLALLALIFCGFMPMLTFYARMPGPHMLATFFLLLAMLCYCYWQAGGQRRWLIGVFVALAIGLWVDWIAYFTAPALIAYHLLTVRSPTRWRFVMAVVGATCLLALSYGVWALLVSNGAVITELRGKLALRISAGAESAEMPIIMFLGLMLQRAAYWLTLPAVLLNGLWALIAIAALVRRNSSRLRAMTLVLLGVGLIHNMALRNRVIIHEFIMLYHLAPACALAAADALASIAAHLRGRWRAPAIGAVGLVLAGFVWQATTVFISAHGVYGEGDRARYLAARALQTVVPQDGRYLSLVNPTWPIIDAIADREPWVALKAETLIDRLSTGRFAAVLVDHTRDNDPASVRYLVERFPRMSLDKFSIFLLEGGDTALEVYADRAEPAFEKPIVYGDQIELLGIAVDQAIVRDELRPGLLERYLVRRPDLLPERTPSFTVTTYWRKLVDQPEPLRLSTRFVSAWGQPYALEQHGGLDMLFPTTEWPVGQIIRNSFEVSIPSDAPDGEYLIWVGVGSASGGVLIPQTEDRPIGRDQRVQLGQIDIRSTNPMPVAEPTQVPQHTADIEVEHFAHLVGYSIEPESDELVVRTYWMPADGQQEDYRLALRLRGSELSIDRIIDLPPPRLWEHAGRYQVETRFPKALAPATYDMSLVATHPTGEPNEFPLESVEWCGDGQLPLVLAERHASHNLPGEIILSPASPIQLQYELRAPHDLELTLAWTGQGSFEKTLVNIEIGNEKTGARQVETHILRSAEPGRLTVRIPRASTAAGLNTVTLSVSDTLHSLQPLSMDLLLAWLEEKRTTYAGWMDVDSVQVRATYTEDLVPSLTSIGLLQGLELAQRMSGCLDPATQQMIISTFDTQLGSIDLSDLSIEQLIDMQSLDETVQLTYAREQLLARMQRNLGYTLLNGSDPEISLLGYTVTPEGAGKTRIDVFFEALAPIEHDYVVVMHGEPHAGTLLPAEREPYGFMNWDQSPAIPTTQWRAGNIYVSSHLVDANIAGYDIFVGVWDPALHLMLNNEQAETRIPLK